MFALMQRCRTLAQQTRPAQPRLEAVLAAGMMHLEDGDVCVPMSGSSVSLQLAAERLAENKAALRTPLPEKQQITYATGAALGLKMHTAQRLALTFVRSGASTARTEDGWQQALAYGFRAQLPLLLLCADFAPPARSHPTALTWASVSAWAKKLRLPVLTVDGTDAVAIYRVMQESTHRARQGDGLAVIWCVLPPAEDRSAVNDPLRKMKSYLQARNLLTQSDTKKRVS